MTTIKGARMMTTIVTRMRRALVNGDVRENEKDNKKKVETQINSDKNVKDITVRAEMTRTRRTRTRMTRTRMTVVKRLKPVSS